MQTFNREKMKRLTILMTLATVFASSCTKYLSEPPKVLADIKTADQLQALQDNVTAGPAWSTLGNDLMMAYGTDDTEIPTEAYKNRPTTFSMTTMYSYVYDYNDMANDVASDAFWNSEYKKIFTCNVILANVDKVSGDEATKKRVRADAYFSRAYAYWTLANYYCQPYSTANLAGPGLPLKKTVDYAESLKRATLQETYDFILADIKEAEALVTYEDVQPLLRWRVSKPAINGFLSRFYLFAGDYPKAIEYANKALATTTAQLVDYNTIGPGTPANYTNPAVTLNYSALNDWTANRYLYWNEMYYDRFAYTSSQFIIPSTGLLSLYDQTNDLRFKLFMIPNGGRRLSVVTPAVYRYTFFSDGAYFPSGPSVAEMLLNKAEAAARTNDVTTANTAINTLRAKRFSSSFNAALNFTTPEDALSKVLLERRREMPFVMRWFDMRRFSVNSDPNDDVTVTRNFFKVSTAVVDVNTPQTYTIKGAQFIVPINGQEINNSRGQLEQNKY
jgi:starch-binding outer membrane protein, SusD/RagB family